MTLFEKLGKVLTAVIFATYPLASPISTLADPSKYPQFAQQTLPEDVKPEFISVDELAKEIKSGANPMIIDVRTAEEFRQAHIRGAISAPLAQFRSYMKGLPRDRLAVLY